MFLLFFLGIFIITCSADECNIPSEGDFCALYLPFGKISDPTNAIPNEKSIAQSASILGIKPVHYNLHFDYSDGEPKKFKADSSVVIKVEKSTKTILLNAHKLNFTSSINLYECESQELICPIEVTKDKDEQWLLFTFAKTLVANKNYILVFERYVGEMGHWSYRETTSAGLWRNNFDQGNWATASIFQMRSARKAFPSFDHPSLKATFDIIVTHSSELMALSNMEADESKKITNGTMVREVFKRTPVIATYVVTFSVLKNFKRHVDNADQPQLEILHPESENESRYLWQIAEARNILGFFKDELGLTYNLSKLALLNISPVQFWGIENFGLVTIESGTPANMYNREELIHRILVHEIVHQWLGNVATISFWDEICLQEGLTAFLEWTISAKLKLANGTFEEKVDFTVSGIFETNQIEFIQEPLVNKYTMAQGIANYCFTRPPAILNMIANMWDKDIWLKFIKIYIQKFAYSNANFTDWEKLLSSLANTTEAGDVLRSWFSEKGEPIVYAKQLSPTTIQFQQKIFYGWRSEGEIPEKGYTIPFKIQTKDGVQKIVVYGNNTTANLQAPIIGPYILDPDSVTFIKKLYSPKNYLEILKCYGARNTTPCFITEKIFADVMNRMYVTMITYNSVLPWKFVEESDTDKEAWLDIFKQMKPMVKANDIKIKNGGFDCAVLIKDEDEFSNDCKLQWNYSWGHTRVMKLIGRNYTFENVQGRPIPG